MTDEQRAGARVVPSECEAGVKLNRNKESSISTLNQLFKKVWSPNSTSDEHLSDDGIHLLSHRSRAQFSAKASMIENELTRKLKPFGIFEGQDRGQSPDFNIRNVECSIT